MKWLSQAGARRAERKSAGMLQAVLGLLAVGLGIAVAVIALPAHAQDGAEPPSRVGRVAYLSGNVQFFDEDEGEWVAATLNRPLTSHNSLWADEGAQAEVGIGSAAIQLDGATQADFSQVDDSGVAVNIARGSAALQLRQVASGEGWTINAAGASLHAVIPGRYALSYSPNTRLVVAKVFSGAARVNVGGNAIALAAGQQATVDTLAEDIRGQEAVRRSSFDDWALARAEAHERSASTRYVSPEMTGAESLDRYGSWSTDPGYGSVWFPTVVVAGWAPYRYGHWAWVSPWGWTWVDDSPWGFAPFHYGRWARIGPRWGWVPGWRAGRPVYAPALVGFYGAGPGSRYGNVGWFPLAPGEIYRPPYYGRDDYVRRINPDRHGNELPIAELRKREKLPTFRYAAVPQAATVVPAPTFRARQPIARATLPWNQQQMSALRPATTLVPVAPPRVQSDRTPGRDPSGGRLQQPGSERSVPSPASPSTPPRNDRRWTPGVPLNPSVPDIRPHVVPERTAPAPAQQQEPAGGPQRVLPRPVQQPGAREPAVPVTRQSQPEPAQPMPPPRPVYRAPQPQAAEPAPQAEPPRSGWRSMPQPERQPERRMPAPAVREDRPQPQPERQPEPRVQPPRPQVHQPMAPQPQPQPQPRPQAQPLQPAPQPQIQRQPDLRQRGGEGQEGNRGRIPGRRDDP